MPKFLSLLLVAGFVFTASILPSFAQAKDEAMEKAWADYRKSDTEVTELYQKILIALPTAPAREKFTEAQNLWLKFRDAQGEFAVQGATSEAQSKLLRAASFTQTTEARLAQLKSVLASLPKQ